MVFLSYHFSDHFMSFLLFKETAEFKKSEDVVPLAQLKQKTGLTIL